MHMGFLSTDGRCFSFDHRANGYSRGEGFGVVVLKRLEDALQDGNTIRAVIRSTGVNSDGYTPGIAQPSGQSQTALIRETYAKAGLDFGVTRFFEAHGRISESERDDQADCNRDWNCDWGPHRSGCHWQRIPDRSLHRRSSVYVGRNFSLSKF